MEKTVDLSKTVYEITSQYPEIIDLMRSLGFKEIIKPGMLASVGRLMTIPKGAGMKKIPMTDIVKLFSNAGFKVTGIPEADAAPVAKTAEPQKPMSRTGQLKDYLGRLNKGEDLEVIRKEFRENFADVEASEIMRAEQELLQEGVPLHEVQQLCDVHSALFHGTTREERIAAAEAEVEASLNREEMARIGADNLSAVAELIAVEGHPLQIFTRENEALARLLQEAKNGLMSAKQPVELLSRIRDISIHYAKKGDLLYPNLKVKYDITGPSDVMWTVDDEIRDELGVLLKETESGDAWLTRAAKLVERAEEMIYKEANILFPICAVNFKKEEWYGIYRDSKPYAVCFGVEKTVWAEAEGAKTEAGGTAAGNGEVILPGGHMTLEQLRALLNTIPMEITFVDADNINRFFNEGEKVFQRPGMAIDREVFSCHPPRIEAIVRGIIGEFRAGTRDSVPVWMEKNGRTILVTYTAVRDHAGKYLGTVELVQDMEFAKAYFNENKQ